VASYGIAGLGLLLALVAIASARRLSRRLDALTQSYWELRYDYTRLRSQLSRLDPAQAEADLPPEPAPPVPPVSFVPLSTMRKKADQ
jgi:hypothetical protein